MTTYDKKKALTSEELFQQQRQLEDDLARLQRRYRILERERDNFQKHSGTNAKAKKVLNILKKEQREINTDLNVAASDANARRDKKIVQTIGEQLADHTNFHKRISVEKAYIRELEMQIIMFSKKLYDVSSQQVTDIQMQARVLNGQKTLDSQENKLEVAVRRFCVVQAGNKQLRDEVNHLLIERTGFNKLFEKLILNLTMGKKFMMDLIEQATIAYDQREGWCSKLAALRFKAYNDIAAHSQECLTLESQIDHEAKLAAFLSTKSQKRIMRQMMIKEHMKREKIRMEMQVLIAGYNNSLKEIQEFTSQEDLDEICEMFLKEEEEIFARFEYVNDLNSQMEMITDELGQFHLQIDQQRALNESRAIQQKDRLAFLQRTYDQQKLAASEEEHLLRDTEEECSKLLKGVEKLFEISKAQKTPFIDLLGNNVKISNFNALLYLEEIEKSVNDLIKLVYYREKVLEKKKTRDALIDDHKIKHSLAGIDVMVPTTPCPLCTEQEHVNDVVDKLQFVLTREAVEKLVRAQRPSASNNVVHNVSACNLPKSREIIQRRYQ